MQLSDRRNIGIVEFSFSARLLTTTTCGNHPDEYVIAEVGGTVHTIYNDCFSCIHTNNIKNHWHTSWNSSWSGVAMLALSQAIVQQQWHQVPGITVRVKT